MSGTSSVSKVTQQHHEIMTSLTALSQEKPRAQITEGKDRSSSWQVDRAGCRLPSNIRPGSVAKNDPGATPGSAQFALSLAALTCSGQQNITNRFVWLLLLFFFFSVVPFPRRKVTKCQNQNRMWIVSQESCLIQAHSYCAMALRGESR